MGSIVFGISPFELGVEGFGGGDFNVILDLSEKMVGIIPPKLVIDEFNGFVSSNSLLDCVTKHGFFTWTNKRLGFHQIVERLDRFLISDNWIVGIWMFLLLV